MLHSDVRHIVKVTVN